MSALAHKRGASRDRRLRSHPCARRWVQSGESPMSNDARGAVRDLTPTASPRSWIARIPVEQLLLALIYFYAARIALLFAFEKTNASPFWPPAGVALTALILGGPRV